MNYKTTLNNPQNIVINSGQNTDYAKVAPAADVPITPLLLLLTF